VGQPESMRFLHTLFSLHTFKLYVDQDSSLRGRLAPSLK